MTKGILYYDGQSRLAHLAVRFLLNRGAGAHYRFAPSNQIPASDRSVLPDSMIIHTASGQFLLGVDAWIEVLRQLSAPWPFVARLLRLVPGRLSAFIYALIARGRYLFGSTRSLYPEVAAHHRQHFEP